MITIKEFNGSSWIHKPTARIKALNSSGKWNLCSGLSSGGVDTGLKSLLTRSNDRDFMQAKNHVDIALVANSSQGGIWMVHPQTFSFQIAMIVSNGVVGGSYIPTTRVDTESNPLDNAYEFAHQAADARNAPRLNDYDYMIGVYTKVEVDFVMYYLEYRDYQVGITASGLGDLQRGWYEHGQKVDSNHPAWWVVSHMLDNWKIRALAVRGGISDTATVGYSCKNLFKESDSYDKNYLLRGASSIQVLAQNKATPPTWNHSVTYHHTKISLQVTNSSNTAESATLAEYKITY